MSFPLILKHLDSVAMRANVVENDWLWYKRLGHLNHQSLRNLKNQELVYELSEIEVVTEVCEGCAMGKQHREPFSTIQTRRATDWN